MGAQGSPGDWKEPCIPVTPVVPSGGAEGWARGLCTRQPVRGRRRGTACQPACSGHHLPWRVWAPVRNSCRGQIGRSQVREGAAHPRGQPHAGHTAWPLRNANCSLGGHATTEAHDRPCSFPSSGQGWDDTVAKPPDPSWRKKSSWSASQRGGWG